jgi:uncharacterized OB-fold protein
MVVCAKCGNRNLDEAEFCGECGRYLKWGDDEPAAAQVPEKVAVAQAEVVQPAPETAPVRHATIEPTETRALQPGDLICGQCGMGNVPTRKFCSRCGHSLAESVAVAVPWWRRVLPRRKRKEFSAGSRPGQDGVRRRTGRAAAAKRGIGKVVRRTIAVIVALAAVLYAAYVPFRTTVNHFATGVWNQATGIFETKYVPVHPTRVTATASEPGHDGNLAADNATNTYWAAPVNGAEPALVFTFDHAADLRRAIIRSGIGDKFQSAHRPAKLHLVFSTGKTFDVALADTPDAQTVDIGNSAGATSVEVHVVALHRSLSGTDVAISEIELFEAG